MKFILVLLLNLANGVSHSSKFIANNTEVIIEHVKPLNNDRLLAEDGKSTSTSTTTSSTKNENKKPDIYENESVEDEMKRFLNKACSANTDCGMS